MDRRTVALGIAAAIAVAAALIVTLAGRSPASPKHKAVAAYIKDVDQIQQQMQAQLTKTVKAYREFSTGGTPPKTLTPQLLQAEQTLKRLQRRIAALPAPEPASRLRKLLVQLTGTEVSIAHEVGQLSVFAPQYSVVLKQARAAGVELSKGLAAVKPPKAHKIRGTKAQVQKAQAAFSAAAAAAAAQQADAVDAYAAKIVQVEGRLRRLHPPRVMRPAYLTQLRTLGASRRSGLALALELRKQNRSRVAVLGRAFTVAARSAGSVSAQKAQIAAIKAYNSRVRGIGTLQGKIQQELQRLQQLTG
jgi:hypothetical protein